MSGISTRQMGRIHASCTQLGVTERPERLRLLSACLYRPVASSTTLTRDEAHIVLLTLDALLATREGRAEALRELIDVAERRQAAGAP